MGRRAKAGLKRELRLNRGISIVLVHAELSLLSDLRRHRLSDVIGAENTFDTLHEAMRAILDRRTDPAAPL